MWFEAQRVCDDRYYNLAVTIAVSISAVVAVRAPGDGAHGRAESKVVGEGVGDAVGAADGEAEDEPVG